MKIKGEKHCILLTSELRDRRALRGIAGSIWGWHGEEILLATVKGFQLTLRGRYCVTANRVSVRAHCGGGVRHCVGAGVPGQRCRVRSAVHRRAQPSRRTRHCRRRTQQAGEGMIKGFNTCRQVQQLLFITSYILGLHNYRKKDCDLDSNTYSISFLERLWSRIFFNHLNPGKAFAENSRSTSLQRI